MPHELLYQENIVAIIPQRGAAGGPVDDRLIFVLFCVGFKGAVAR